MSTRPDDHSRFEAASTENARLLRKEELILEVTEAITRAMAEQKVTKAELATRLGRSPSFVTQILGGGRNLTLRTIAEVAAALRANVRFDLVPSGVPARRSVKTSPRTPTARARRPRQDRPSS